MTNNTGEDQFNPAIEIWQQPERSPTKIKKLEKITIQIKPLTLKDSEAVYDLFSNKKVLKSYLERPIKEKSLTSGFIRRITSEGNWTWKIYQENKPESFLGICGLHHLDKKNRTIEIGGTLMPNYWGKGIMKQTFEFIIEIARKDMEINRVIAKTSTRNKQAIRLVEKLGFTITKSNETETHLLKTLTSE
tara:strand:+ start:33 stop:602 length:570 start_codon:yes stop_codon:yes gene_type:complete